jgi:hypothetical protein
MFRFSLTICSTCILFGLSAPGMQNPAQIRTGTAAGGQQPGTPVYRTQVVPRSPGAAAKSSRPITRPATSPQRPTPSATARPQSVAAAPQKDPSAANAPAAATLPPMGPPYPAPEIPKPSRPADMPPVPPHVSYRNGMLTVNAVNSTMTSVLSAIRAKTGIEFEGAQNSSERVVVNLGPAPEGDVLAGIFSGSTFDYVVLGRPDSPGTVQRVILTPKARGGAGAVAGQPPQQPMQNPQAQAQAQQEGDEDVPPEDAADQEPQDAPVQPPPVQEPPTAQNQQQNNQPKTPEQLLEELKQMQLQQQQQQGQPPPDTNSVPRKMPPR